MPVVCYPEGRLGQAAALSSELKPQDSQSTDDLELLMGEGGQGSCSCRAGLEQENIRHFTLRQSNQSYLRVHSGLAIFALNPECLKFEILGYPWTAGCQPQRGAEW